jgi:signal transduction histidine kinase
MYAHKSLFLFLVLILFFASCPSKAQGSRILYYNNTNGLPQRTVTDLAYDKYGFLWIGTEGGLVRFNGQSFEQPDEILQNPRVKMVRKSITDTLWVFDEGKSLYYFDHTRARLVLYQEDFVNHLCIFWEKILGRSPSKKWDCSKPYFLALPLRAQFTDEADAFYCRTENYQAIYVDGEVHPIKDIAPYSRILLINNQLVARRNDGSLGVNIGRKLSYHLTGLQGIPGPEVPVADFWMASYLFHSEGKSYAIYKGTLYALDIHNRVLTVKEIMSGIPEGLGINTVIYNNQTGVLAIGTITEGLLLIQKRLFFNDLIDRPPGKDGSQYFDFNNITSLVELKDGSVLANNGAVYNKGRISQKFSTSEIFPHFIFTTSTGQHWYMNNLSLVQLDGELNEIKRLHVGQNLFGMVEESPDEYWAVTRNAILQIHCPDAKCSVKKVIDPNIKKTIVGLFAFSKQELWLSAGDGLYRFNTQTQEIKRDEGAPKFNFRDVGRSQKTGEIWVGTYGNGFFLHRDNRLIPMPLDEKKFLLYAHTFLADQQGFLWISTNNGLFQVFEEDLIAYAEGRSAQVYYHYYDKSYGYADNEFNGGGTNSGLIASDGTFYFSSMTGLVRMKPEQIVPLLPDAPLRIEYLIVNDEARLPGESNLILPPNFSRMLVKVDVPFFGHPYNLMIQYRVLGLDSIWRKLPDNQLVEIPNIRQGKYTLEFRKLNGFGFANEDVLELDFRVWPYFYQRPIFFLAMVVLFCMAVYWTVRWRIDSLEEKNRLLDLKVQKRTATLQVALDNLREQQKDLISRQEAFQAAFQVVMHDLVSPLRFLRRLSQKIISDYRRMDMQELQQDLDTMQASAAQAEQFTRDLLTWMKTQESKLSPQEERCNIQELLNRNLLLYHWIADEKGLSLLVEAPKDDREIVMNVELIGVVLRNLLDNAVKNTHVGSVKVSAEIIEAKQLLLKIEDTGIGLKEAAVQQMNMGTAPYSLEHDKHLGVRMIFDILKILNGTMQVESTAGKGTTVTVTIPISG